MRDVEIHILGDVSVKQVRVVLEQIGAYSLDDIVPGRMTLERKNGIVFISLGSKGGTGPVGVAVGHGRQNSSLSVVINIGSGESSDSLVYEIASKLLAQWQGAIIGINTQWSLDEVAVYYRQTGVYPWLHESNESARKAIEKLKKERKGPYRP